MQTTSASVLNAEQAEKRAGMVAAQTRAMHPRAGSGSGRKTWAFDRFMFDGPFWTELRRTGQQRGASPDGE